jgi:hypothetical protein
MARAYISRKSTIGLAVAIAFALGLGLGQAIPPAVGGPVDAPLAEPAAATPSPAARPNVDYVGSIELSPNGGPIGTSVEMTGQGFDPDATFQVVWQAFRGAWLTDDTPENFHGREYSEEEITLAEVRSDEAGAIRTTFTVPDGFGFAHDVRLVQDGVTRNQRAFQVEMQVSISPTSGPLGTPITIEVEGIGVSPLHSSWLVTYDNKFTGWLSAVTTNGRARAVIPATGSPGPHVIKILHGSFTFPYMNMQQSPDPTRPTFTEIFTVTDGEPVLPAPTEEQAPPVVAGATPTAGDGASVWLESVEGPVGTTTLLHGTGLPADAELTVHWQTEIGVDPYIIGGTGEERPEAEWDLGTLRTDEAGTTAWEFAVPEDKGGDHVIVVRHGDAVVANAVFRIRPSANPLSPSSGPVGTVITINLKGVDDTDTGKIFHVVYDNAMLGYACSVTSQGDITIYLPAAGEPGWHFIDLYPGIYKGEDIPGNYNFRIPQLTYAEDHPGEEMTAFRFAFEVTD